VARLRGVEVANDLTLAADVPADVEERLLATLWALPALLDTIDAERRPAFATTILAVDAFEKVPLYTEPPWLCAPLPARRSDGLDKQLPLRDDANEPSGHGLLALLKTNCRALREPLPMSMACCDKLLSVSWSPPAADVPKWLLPRDEANEPSGHGLMALLRPNCCALGDLLPLSMDAEPAQVACENVLSVSWSPPAADAPTRLLPRDEANEPSGHGLIALLWLNCRALREPLPLSMDAEPSQVACDNWLSVSWSPPAAHATGDGSKPAARSAPEWPGKPVE